MVPHDPRHDELADDSAVLLTQADLRGIISISDAVADVEQAYRDWGKDRTLNYLCKRTKTADDVRVCVHQAAAPSAEGTGLLVHCEQVSNDPEAEHYLHAAAPISILFSAITGRLAGLILGEPTASELPDVRGVAGLRTAATSVVGTNAMASPEAKTLGLIGSGRQAAIHLIALAASRPLDRVLVFSRNRDGRIAFAESMSRQAGVEVVPAESAQQAVEESAIVLTATNSSKPVIEGRWLSPGQHVTSIVGGMVGLSPERQAGPGRRELDDATDSRASTIGLASFEQLVYGFEEVQSDLLVDSYRQARAAYPHWEKTVDLGDLVIGRSVARTSANDITVFKNNAGQGLGDVAIGMAVLRAAKRLSLGTAIAA